MVYAKSEPLETIPEHTKNVLLRCASLKNSCYADRIISPIPSQYKQYFWDALYLVCKIHDLGKLQARFQNKILKKHNKEELRISDGIEEIPHNIISAAFLDNYINGYPKEIRPAIYQAVAFHHSRGSEYIKDGRKWILVIDCLDRDICNRLNELNDMYSDSNIKLEYSIPSTNYRQYLTKQIKPNSEEHFFYILLKGCLHRCDHSASAHFEVEIDPCKHSTNQVTDYLIDNIHVQEDKIWQYKLASSFCEDNVILQAGTGSGKTEFALYWLGNNKAFYTLPMRTSVNAMYERISKTYNSNNIGLLHADTALYTLSKLDLNTGSSDDIEENLGLMEALDRIDLSKQLSMPLSVSTADQIFTTAFRYKGYEKIFATLAYSRLVVDEIQSYDPAIVAIILKTLIDLQNIHCNFCIVTATLPKMYLDFLCKNIKIKNLPPIFNSIPRHRVKLLSKPLSHPDTIDFIINLSIKYTNVLITANTVKIAQEIKKKLNSQNVDSNLLHSMFTYEDRDIKENCILKQQKGIWITTQIAEVSLNIDFDVMVTEISSIDSQIQRWDRVWRNRKKPYEDLKSNIYITPIPSDYGHIYDQDLVKCSLMELDKKMIDNSMLSDMDEYELVQAVFEDDELMQSKYIENFKTSLRVLTHGIEVDSKRKAQQLFRSISNVTVIPNEIYSNNRNIIDEALDIIKDSEHTRVSRLKALYMLRNKTVTVPSVYLRDVIGNSNYDIYNYKKLQSFLVVDMKYSHDLGVELATVNSAYLI